MKHEVFILGQTIDQEARRDGREARGKMRKGRRERIEKGSREGIERETTVPPTLAQCFQYFFAIFQYFYGHFSIFDIFDGCDIQQ